MRDMIHWFISESCDVFLLLYTETRDVTVYFQVTTVPNLIMLASRRNIHHRPALLGVFVILAQDTKLRTYLLT